MLKHQQVLDLQQELRDALSMRKKAGVPVVQGFERWRDSVVEERQMKAKALKVVHRPMNQLNRVLVEGLERWWDQAVEEEKMKTKALKAARRLMNWALVEGFDRWRHQATEEKQMKAKPSSVHLLATEEKQMKAKPSSNNSLHGATAETAETALLPPPAIPEHAEVDGRPVRGVVTLQARPSPMANERPRSALLIASKGSLMVEELRQPYTRLLELPLEHVATQAVPGHDTMFHIAACPPGAEQRDLSTIGTEGIVVVLRDCSLRDRWLDALEAAGTRVNATGWHPAAGTAEQTRTPTACFGHGFESPLRWLH